MKEAIIVIFIVTVMTGCAVYLGLVPLCGPGAQGTYAASVLLAGCKQL
jgi:hypothetical protein